MRSSAVRRLIVVGAVLALPVTGYAQQAALEATLSGTVTDTTGGVLPGVTVVAQNEASGNTFEGVTDALGVYRIPVRVGVYRITAELPGFRTVIRTGLEVLVGQEVVANFEMVVSTLQESVTVTGESPLIDVTQSRMGGNIDPRQMQELPVNGRNPMDLVILAPGNRANSVTDSPVPRERGDYQINVDGQQVTDNVAGSSFGQPRYSRDAIAEFEFVANRFDATQGRSAGVQVNAITKSGTNTPSGSLAGYFRDDRFNAADFVAKRVLPYSNQQVSTTFGGPIRKDKVHFFANYEYEREPQTFTFNTPYPRFNLDQTGTRRENKAGVRLDFQFSPRTRFAVRANGFSNLLPYDPRWSGGAIRTPSAAIEVGRYANQVFGTLTQVLSNRVVNEIKGGYAGYYWRQSPVAKWPNAPTGVGIGAPQILLRGLTIGQVHLNSPQRLGQELYSIRDDLTYSFTKGGRHDLKLGGEYVYSWLWAYVCRTCVGIVDAQGGPIPANIEDLFPNMYDITTWNLTPLSPITRRYSIGVGDMTYDQLRNVYAGWVQDDWRVTPRLTLNLGLRYDLQTGVWGNFVALPPFLEADRPDDRNNVGPRLGFAFSLNARTVLRGGFGKYFAEITSNLGAHTESFAKTAQLLLLNDGRPDFASSPFNGPIPTFAQVERTLCPASPGPSCLRRSVTNMASPTVQTPYSYQTSIGVQRQLGDSLGVEADYTFIGLRHGFDNQNINLSYNPATGANFPFTDISRRPYPDWGIVSPNFTESRSNYQALQMAFTKRLSHGWQASATYLLSGLWDGSPRPLGIDGTPRVSFELAPDMGAQYSLATTDQRHRAVVNGIWQLRYGFQLSGLYFYGSGERFETTYGGDLRQTGLTGGRLRPDGTVVSRNNFVGKPLHRLDLRIQRRFSLGGRARVDGILEVFNVFNHANYGSYVTVESNRNYGQPSANTNVVYQPRILQLGFRVTF